MGALSRCSDDSTRAVGGRIERMRWREIFGGRAGGTLLPEEGVECGGGWSSRKRREEGGIGGTRSTHEWEGGYRGADKS